MDSCLLTPRRPLRPRGLIGLAVAALGGTVLAVPGLLLLDLVWLLVTAFCATLVALPIAAASSVDPLAGLVVGGLLGLVTLPFAILWLVAGFGAAMALLASRTVSAPLSVGEALGLGLRRALPLLGSALVIKGLGLLAMLPASLLAITLALLDRGVGPQSGPAGQLLRALGLPLIAVAGLVGLYFCFRLLWAPWSALLEDAGPLEAVERAWTLSRGQAGRVLGMILTGLLLAALVVWGLAFLAIGPLALQATALSSWLDGLGTATGAALDRLAALVGDLRPLALNGRTLRPDLAGAVLLALALPLAVVSLVYAGLSAFFLDLLRRREGFGARERARPEPAELPADLAAPLVAPVPVPNETVAPIEPAEPAETAAGDESGEPYRPYEPEVNWNPTPGAGGVTVQEEPAAFDAPGSAGEVGNQDEVDDAPEKVDVGVAEAPMADPVAGETGPLDLGRIEGISVANASDRAAEPRKSRWAWLWSWLPEPERPEGD